MDFGAIGHQAQQQFRFGDELIADVGRSVRPRQRGATAAERDLEPQPVAGEHLPPELRVVDAAQVGPGIGRRIVALQQENRRHLRERFQHQHAGHQRRARKVALEELLVDRDVLDGDETATRFVLGDPIHEHGRKPVAQPIQENGNIDHKDANAQRRTSNGTSDRTRCRGIVCVIACV